MDYISEREINSFRGDNYFLSNFFLSDVTIDGMTFTSSESAFQSCKSLDREIRLVFTDMTPRGSKDWGKRVKLRDDWEEVKAQKMYEVVLAKFKSNPDLGIRLLKTGQAYLTEGNTWHDNIWGECSCPRCENKDKQNLLGKVLMRVRLELAINQSLGNE